MQMTLEPETENGMAKAIAAEMTKQAMPVLREMIRQAVADQMPTPPAMNRGELAKRLRTSNSTRGMAKADLDRLADEVLPSYHIGSERRWDRRAVDKFLENYSE
ncbi:hypothetical protein [Lacticaseibacillus songhuajiangensis]|jgi:hypothetical protein|uniref:hypothetical protein n=1 Tax=Lacticaseibacillus songhuajiangensis TaxID=1296539 RepID=UPI000F7A10AF|nr:hypothetical protein [Lacticaseibacillus songhuajiangensis]